MTTGFVVNVEWVEIEDHLWNCYKCLYAYYASHEILYIGKAYDCSIRERWRRSGKRNFWDALEKERGVYSHYAIAGFLKLPYGKKISKELVNDIESLLIAKIQPWGNIQSTRSRISRPGMKVVCSGDWPLKKKTFLDI